MAVEGTDALITGLLTMFPFQCKCNSGARVAAWAQVAEVGWTSHSLSGAMYCSACARSSSATRQCGRCFLHRGRALKMLVEGRGEEYTEEELASAQRTPPPTRRSGMWRRQLLKQLHRQAAEGGPQSER